MKYTIMHFDQGSEEWFNIKKSHISGTLSYDLLKNGKNHALQLALEHATNSLRMNGRPISKAAKRGCDLEPDARNLLTAKLRKEKILSEDESVEEVGFVVDNTYDCVGCSPDGVIYKDKDKTEIKQICEIKCFGFKHHESCHQKIDDGIMCQIQWNMWVTDSELCYFVQYNPDYLDNTLTVDGKRHPEKVLYITKIRPDEKYINAFKEALKND